MILEKESDNAKDEYEIMVSTTCVQHKDEIMVSTTCVQQKDEIMVSTTCVQHKDEYEIMVSTTCVQHKDEYEIMVSTTCVQHKDEYEIMVSTTCVQHKDEYGMVSTTCVQHKDEYEIMVSTTCVQHKDEYGIMVSTTCVQHKDEYGIMVSTTCVQHKDEYGIMVSTTCVQHKDEIMVSTTCVQHKDEYEIMVSTTCVQHKDEFLSFNINEDRLDLFLAKYLAGAKEYSNLWKVVKILLIISHGQSDVERGFSVNKEISVQNMQKPSLIFQRIIYDYMHTENVKPTDLVIDKGLVVSCRGASNKYKQSLEEKKKEMVDAEVSRKRKMKQEDILEIKKKEDEARRHIGNKEKGR